MDEKTKEKMRKDHVKRVKETEKKQSQRFQSMKSVLEGMFKVTDLSAEKDLSAGGFSTGYQEIDDLLTGQTDKEGETIPGTGIGFPRGRIVEIYGPEGASKTSLCLMAVADAQRKGGLCGFVDVEHALDLDYAQFLGVDTAKLLVVTPDNGEEALAAAEKMVRGGCDLVVVDSIAAIVPESELSGEVGESTMGAQARLMGSSCRRLTSALERKGCSVLFTNQIRLKIGVVFGNPESLPGGNAMKFFASIRVDLRLIDKLTRKNVHGETRVYGVRVRAKTIKNKVAPPHREMTFDIIYNVGIRIPTRQTVKADKAAKKEFYAKKTGKKK